MCGIVGVVSETHNVAAVLRNGLAELMNRGYDSVGFSLLRDQSFIIRKDATHDVNALFAGVPDDDQCRNGIAHSRWATHGGATRANAHPHSCPRGLFCMVHNGIIENYQELKATLPPDSVFQSETDTEVIAHLMSQSFAAQPADLALFDRVCRSVYSVARMLRGTYGLVVQFRLLPDCLFCLRYGSPLVVGVSPKNVVVASEKGAFPPSTTKCFPLEDHDLVVIRPNPLKPITRIHGDGVVVFEDNTSVFHEDEKPAHMTWTEKEVTEQPEAIRRCVKNNSRLLPDDGGVRLGGLEENKDRVERTDHVILLGCGTSFHACLLAAHDFRTMRNRIQTTQACDASEFDVSIVPKAGNTTLIVVSQSGETMDALLAVRRFRQACPDALVLGVVNVVDSVIAREVDGGVYTNSGRERGVASTKSFTAQVLALRMVACAFAPRCPSVPPCIRALRVLADVVERNLPGYAEQVKMEICPIVLPFQNVFIVGKSADYYVAMEAALKIKEISYVHAEAYSSSSLKHGPFALLDESMLVVLLTNVPSERAKLENAYQEIVARRAPVLVVGYENIHGCPHFVCVPYHFFSYLEANVVMQLLALELSLAKGIHPDFPKNLAKVVTVE